jgi:serine/threonine-protein kinase
VERPPGPEARRPIRVVASLARNEDGEHLWNETIEELPANLFGLQTRLAEAVPRALGIPLHSNEREWLRTNPTDNLRAYEQYLRGGQYLRRGRTDAALLRTAIRLFRSAQSLDSGFVHAYAKLSIAHTTIFSESFDRSPGRLVEAKAAADRAVFLGAGAPISHFAMAWYYYLGTREYDRALRHFEIANASWAGLGGVSVYLGDIRRRRGDLEQALADYGDAVAANPSCVMCVAEAAVTHMMLGDFDAAEREAARAVAMAPDLPYPRRVAAMVQISGGGSVETARRLLGPANGLSEQQLMELAAGRWGAVPRILAGDFDVAVNGLVLTTAVLDTAAYFLAKAELATRRNEHVQAGAYYDFAGAKLVSLVRELPDDARLRGRLSLAYAGLGRRDEAVAEGLEATRLIPLSEDLLDGAETSEILARVYVMLDEADAAISRLETLLAEPTLMTKELLRLDPVWAALRENHRFQRLIR